MTLSTLCVNADRLREDFEALAKIGATGSGGVNRLALSNEDLEARAWYASQIDEAGLVVRDDDAGNLSGILLSPLDDARTLLVGSHLDTVPNGGKYDGSVGVLAALECLRTIKEAGIALPVHLEAINFTDDEGCWQSLFGSRGLTGKLTPLYPVDRDADNGAFRAALFRAGIRPSDVHKAARDPDSILGYLELHIEQGARLYRSDVPIGIVTGIVGRTTYKLTFHGETGHSGTAGLDERRDALRAAAAFIIEAHHRVSADHPEGIFNCGNILVEPGAFNLIPSVAELTIECRHPREDALQVLEAMLLTLAEDSAHLHHVTVTSQRVIHMPAAAMSEWVMDMIEDAGHRIGVQSMTRMVSYAGHDAQMLSDFTPSGMIFIPSALGVAHNPREFTEWDHVVLGANVLLHTLLNMALYDAR